MSVSDTIKNLAQLGILTPSLKDYKTEKFKLTNSLNVFIVSDPGAREASAALCVNTGSWKDPKDNTGCAHFLEHMLFLGTEKFPDEAEFGRYLAVNGGSSNAFTASDNTTYYFSVKPDKLEGALDRFSQFFIAPLFTGDLVDREINAVDSEFKKNIESDGWRQLMVSKELANQNHPFSLFNIGNLETMKLIDPEFLKSWYADYYSANIMYLVIYGTESLDTLRGYANAYFTSIVNKNIQNTAYVTPKNADPPASDSKRTSNEPAKSVASNRTSSTQVVPILTSANTSRWVYIEPIKDKRNLSLNWEIPFAYHNLDYKTDVLVSHVVGDEGEESILAQLKREDLAEGLSAGSHLEGENLQFTISVTLTQKGLAQKQTVVQRIFEGIKSFLSKPFPKYIWDEVGYMAKVDYQYQSRTNACHMAQNYLGRFRVETYESFPVRSLFYVAFDQEAAKRLLTELTPESCYVIVVAKRENLPDVKLDKTEKWMGVKYSVSPFSKDELTSWKSGKPHPKITYSAPNPFTPNDLTLTTLQPQTIPPQDVGMPWAIPPKLLINDPQGTLYYLQDSVYRIPEVCFSFDLKTPVIRPDNIQNTVLAHLYERFVHERLIGLTYPAATAGLHFSYGTMSTGMRISIQGYSQKALNLLEQLVTKIANVGATYTAEEFKTFLDYTLKSYKNQAFRPPLDQARARMQQVIFEKYVPQEKLAQAVEKGLITIDGLKSFTADLYKRFFVQCVISGNIKEEDAKKAWSIVQNGLTPTEGAATTSNRQSTQPKYLSRKPVTKEEIARSKAIVMKQQTPLHYREPVPVAGTGAILLLDLLAPEKNFSFTTDVSRSILNDSISDLFYEDLRTKQQCGYIVYAGTSEIEKRLYLFLMVQSSSHLAPDLFERYEEFFTSNYFPFFLQDAQIPAADVEPPVVPPQEPNASDRTSKVSEKRSSQEAQPNTTARNSQISEKRASQTSETESQPATEGEETKESSAAVPSSNPSSNRNSKEQGDSAVSESKRNSANSNASADHEETEDQEAKAVETIFQSPADHFESIRQASIDRITKPLENLYVQSDYWRSIINFNDADWQWTKKKVDAYKELEFEKWRDWLIESLSLDKNPRRIRIWTSGTDVQKTDTETVPKGIIVDSDIEIVKKKVAGI